MMAALAAMGSEDGDNAFDRPIVTSARSFDDAPAFGDESPFDGPARVGIQDVSDFEGEEFAAEQTFIPPPMFDAPVRRAEQQIVSDPFDAMPAFEVTRPDPLLVDRAVTVLPASEATKEPIMARPSGDRPFVAVQIGAGALDFFTRQLDGRYPIDNVTFAWCRAGSYGFSDDGMDTRQRHKFTRHYPLDRILVDVFAYDSARVRLEVEEKMAAIEAEALREGLPIGYLAVVRGCVPPKDVFSRVKAGEVLPLHLEASQIYQAPSPVLTFL